MNNERNQQKYVKKDLKQNVKLFVPGTCECFDSSAGWLNQEREDGFPARGIVFEILAVELVFVDGPLHHRVATCRSEHQRCKDTRISVSECNTQCGCVTCCFT